MPSKSKKQGSGPANIPKAPLTTKPLQSLLKTTGSASPVDRSVRTQENQVVSQPTNTSETTEEEPWPAAGSSTANKSLGDSSSAPAVNRKKQKRRAKEAAKRAEQQLLQRDQAANQVPSVNGSHAHATYSQFGRGPPKGYFTEETEYTDPDFVDDTGDMDTFYSGGEEHVYTEEQYDHDGFPLQGTSAGGKSKKKRKNKKGSTLPLQQDAAGGSSTSISTPLGGPRPQPPPPTLSNAALRMGHKMSRDQIWNTSTQAEKENIKSFWLELGEEERRSLVKVEKEAVLRKMKEQQKHSCSCTVCGRKRTAIEEELEVLYDAYYVELEQYANHNNGNVSDAPLLGKSRASSHANGMDPTINSHLSTRSRIEDLDDEDILDEEYDEEDEEDDYSDDEDYDQQLPPGPPDFFTFGNSLTVRDGILTVADDLLKNDGKRFIDMMEQLAERRMQREDETQYPSAALAHQNLHQGHNHPLIDEDDDYDDEEEDEEYDSPEEEDYEVDDMDSMTETQRMEEGRRMFQIFAARMFEQRVLTAYREKVARERQQKLLEELDEENRLDTQREAKKAREAARKKEKKKAQKAAKDEEKAKREAEKAAQEEAVRAAEQKRLEEQKQRKEEQKKRREADRKAQEDERAKKEVEKQRKSAEERERQAETERKQREAKEREKKKKEEARKKEREEREAREREAKERRAKEDQERRAREDHARKDKEAAAKAEREAKDQAKQQVSQVMKRQAVAIPPGFQGPNASSVLQSPHNAIATPILPKAPTPVRARQPSQQSSQQGQQSHGSSPRSQQAATDNSTSSHSPASIVPPAGNPQFKPQAQVPILHHPQPSAPLSPLNTSGRTHQSTYSGFSGGPSTVINGIQSSAPGMPPGMIQQIPMYPGPPMGGQHRSFGPPNGIPFPPGINGARPYHPNQPFHSQAPMPPPTSNPHPHTERNIRSQPHSRHPSGSAPYDSMSQDVQPAPISRPGPIGGPSNTTPDKPKSAHARHSSKSPGVDELATQLGSKALLDDSDVPLSSNPPQPSTAGPGQPGSNRISINPFAEHESFHLPGTHQSNNATWGGAFGSSNPPGVPNWGPPSGKPDVSGWPSSTNNPPSTASNTFSGIGGYGIAHRPNAPRPVTIRLMIAQACHQLSLSPASPIDSGGFHAAQAVLRQVELIRPPQEPMPSLNEVLAICDTEGNAQNGGGSFTVREESGRGAFIRFEPDGGIGGVAPRGSAAPGDIGSPIVGHKEMSGFGGVVGGYRAL